MATTLSVPRMWGCCSSCKSSNTCWFQCVDLLPLLLRAVQSLKVLGKMDRARQCFNLDSLGMQL